MIVSKKVIGCEVCNKKRMDKLYRLNLGFRTIFLCDNCAVMVYRIPLFINHVEEGLVNLN